MSIVFGPVPSRRLGKSLGINNIPPKECTYACVYCQLGNTLKLEIERRKFYSPEEIYEEVKLRLDSLDLTNEKIDYLTFVPDGEPTLDENLGKSISALKKFGIKLAVITNSSLIFEEKIRKELSEADWVSVKVDAMTESVWRKIDRPHGNLDFKRILNGIIDFSNEYKNYFVTETMLVQGVNDDTKEIEKITDFIFRLNVKKSYITIPTRPPAEGYVAPPDAARLNEAFQIFSEKGINVELLIGYEGNEFSSTGNFKEDILNITAVHPMRQDAVMQLMKKDNAKENELEELLNNESIKKISYENNSYYLRNLKHWRKEIN